MGKAAILLVEDEQIVALDIQQRLTRLGYTVTGIAISGEEAVRMATDTRPHIILMDIHLRGDTDGIEAAEEIRSSMSVPIIYLTAYTDDQTLERAKITDPFGYLIKPFEERELYITIEMALYRHSLERQLQDSEERYRQLFQQNENAIILFDSVSSHVIDVNPSVERLFGYPAHILMDQGLEAILTGNAWPQLTSCFGAGADESFRLEEINARHRNGHSLTLAIHGQKIHLTQGHQIYCFLYDITEKIRLQKEKEQIRNRLIHANKMTALGTMSSGIAHEINNPNNFIVFNAQLLADAWKDALPILEAHRRENGEFPLAGFPSPRCRRPSPNSSRE